METAERLASSSLDEIVDIPGHVCFVEDLLGRYVLDSSRKDTWTAALERIRDRQTDPDLYLAVVGEFSSGKSSLVNALIRQELCRPTSCRQPRLQPRWCGMATIPGCEWTTPTDGMRNS